MDKKLKDLLLGTPEQYMDAAFGRNLGLLDYAAQKRLEKSRIAIAGMGGVGGVHLMTLARTGIGRFTVADMDAFSVVNVNRQFGATVPSFGQPKLATMVELARGVNPYLDIMEFPEGIHRDNIDVFLKDVDMVVDGIDFFAFKARRMLFTRAMELGIPVVTAGPIGFSSAMLVFLPESMKHRRKRVLLPGAGHMTFDQYFDITADMPEVKKYLHFAMGLAPRPTHLGYLDRHFVDLHEKRGPSLHIACQLCAALAATEVVRVLTGTGAVRAVPQYTQFDPNTRTLRKGVLLFGNRNPLQRLKIAVADKFLLAKSGRKGLEVPDAPDVLVASDLSGGTMAESSDSPVVSVGPPIVAPAAASGVSGMPDAPELSAAPAAGWVIDDTYAEYVIRAGVQAPSGDNVQPWWVTRVSAATSGVPCKPDMPDMPEMSDTSDTPGTYAKEQSSTSDASSAQSHVPDSSAVSGSKAAEEAGHEAGANVSGWQGIDVYMRPEADTSFFNVRQMASMLSCGAVVENMRIAASALGLGPQVEWQKTHSAAQDTGARTENDDASGDVRETRFSAARMARIRFAPDGTEQEEVLHDAMWRRCTNRTMYRKTPVPHEVWQRLATEVERIGLAPDAIRLDWVAGKEAQKTLGKSVCTADRIRVERQDLHEYFMSMVRFSDAEDVATGLPLKNLCAGGAGEVFLRLTKPWKSMAAMNAIGLGRMIPMHSARAMMYAGGAGLLSLKRADALSVLTGGQALERIWIMLEHMGYAFQPMTAITLFRVRQMLEGDAAFSEKHQRLMYSAWDGVEHLFPAVAGRIPLMLFRTGKGPRLWHGTHRKPWTAFVKQ